MITLQLSDEMRDDLRVLMLAEIIRLGKVVKWGRYTTPANVKAEQTAKFERAVQFLNALTLPADHARFNQSLHLAPDFDPRAENPRCVHGRLFSEPCDLCGMQ